jgi:hypothetical protein
MNEPDCIAGCIETPQSAPLGQVGRVTDDRDESGRFVRRNRAAIVTGEHSAAFWASQESARREIVAALVSDAGHAVDDAPRGLVVAADGIAQALLLRDSAFLRLVEMGGPLTASGRTRRAYAVWLSASDRVERLLRLVGLTRRARNLESLQRLLEAPSSEEPTS